MTKEEKQLLLKDLCTRLPYGIKIQLKNTYRYHCDKMCNIGDFTIDEIKSIDKKGEHIKIYHNDPLDYEWYIDDIEIEDIKPYLRPMSSMTSEEKSEYNLKYDFGYAEAYNEEVFCATSMIDFFNAHHLDYRGLIPKGLALEAPKDMYEI